MKPKDFTLTLHTTRSPEQVFDAILNVRKWWTGYHNEKFRGKTKKLNDEFDFTAAGGLHRSTQKIVTLIPHKKVVWLITDSALEFVEKTNEWQGSEIIFEIVQKDRQTELTFTHKGLTPEIECYDSCAPSWTQYLKYKLLPLINDDAKK